MTNPMKIAAGLGLLAGASFFGKKRMDIRNRMFTHRLAAMFGAILGFGKGFGRGISSTFKSIFHIRTGLRSRFS